MVRVLLRHNRININLRNQWFEDLLILAVKGGTILDYDQSQTDTLQFEEISGLTKKRLHLEGHSNQNGR